MEIMPKIKNWKLLVFSILLCEGAGILGSFFVVSSITTWYNLLNKPSFFPPNSVFGPVWGSLYFLMGIALYLVWSSKGKSVKHAVNLFYIQLGLNVIWSIIFFGIRNLSLGFIEIIVLWIMIIVTIIAFYKISKPAAFLLYPYLAWVTFAGYLNLAVWVLNR